MMAADDPTGTPGADPPRPSWLTGPCPAWCTRQHAEDDHPEDRYHQSQPTLAAAIAGTGDAVPVTASLQPATLAARAGRYADDDLTWLVVEPLEGRPYLVITAASARGLVHVLQEQLRGLDAEAG